MNHRTGLIVNQFDYQERKDDGGIIEYSSGNKLVYTRIDPARGFTYDYYFRDKRFRLNDLVGNNHWRFIPVDGRFQVYFHNKESDVGLPEVHIPLQANSKYFRLKHDELWNILALLHEVGHAYLYTDSHRVLSECFGDTGALESLIADSPLKNIQSRTGVKTDLPRFSQSFNHQLIQTVQFFAAYFSGFEYQRFQERLAWAFAFRTVRKHNLLTQFDLKDFRECYIPHLSSYGNSFVKDKRRYGKVLAGDPDFWEVRTEKRSWKKC